MLDLVLRNTPKIAELFVFEDMESQIDLDSYEVFSREKQIVIRGNSNIAKAMGYYHYLREYCNCLITSGDFDISYIKTAPLPKEKLKFTVSQRLRLAFTYERYSAEIDSWGFDRWEKELDFMAMCGVNTPLILNGTDGVLYKTLMEDFRFKKETALDFISGSGYFYRQLQGDIFGYLPMYSEEYFDKKIEVGAKATERAKELGMQPIHQGYIPTVPFSFRRNYSKTDLIKRPVWNSFAPAMTIEPGDETHIKIFQEAFLNKQKELLGDVHNYIFDPLVDVKFKGYNSFIEKTYPMYLNFIKNYDEKAVWFVNSKAVNMYPQRVDGLVFIDEDGSHFSQTNAFNGNDFVVGYKGNIFGRNVVCGDMKSLSENPYAKIKSEYENAVGTGVFFDSDSANPLFYSLALKMLTAKGSVNLEDFAREYAHCKYGNADNKEFLLKVIDLCYGENSNLNQASALCARPCTELKHTAPFDTFQRPYQNKDLFCLVKEIIESDCKKNEAFRADLQELFRQALSNVLYPIYQQVVACFRNKAIQDFEKTTNAFLEIGEDVDRLLKTVEKTNLFTQIDVARQLGDTKEVRQNLEVNFLMYLTVYGPLKNSPLYDTNWREWGGMAKDFYLKRWYMFFRMMASYFDKPKKFKDMSKKLVNERNEYADSLLTKRFEYMENEWIKDYIPRPSGIGEEDTIEVIKELIEKYEAIVMEF